MRNLKKVLSLVLCVAMMLSVMVVGAGAAFSDQSKIKNTEAVDACTALNIIGGYPDGSFKPEGNITRAEVTKMICVALNGGKNPAVSTNTTPTFSDVRNNANAAWAEGYIESCAAQGIVSGVGGGKFAPNGNVTGVQLAKMLLVSLGYKSENEGFTGNAWATNVNVRAAQKGLYAGLEKMDSNAAITRDNAARMVWNALQAYEVEYKTNLVAGANGQLSTQVTVSDKVDGNFKKITLLRDKYDAWTNVGTLVGVKNNEISLYMNDADQATSDLVNKTDSANIKFTKVSKDYSELMGQKVKVIFKNGKTNDVIGVYATSDNTTYTVNQADIDTSGAKIDANGTKLSVDSKGVVVYTDGQKTAEGWTAASFKNEKSANVVTLIDTDGDNDIDTACIKTYTVGKVTSVSSSSVIIGGKTNKFDDDHISTDLKKDDWASITENLYNDNKDIVKADMKTTKVDATKNQGENPANYKVEFKLDGTWYTVASTAKNDIKNNAKSGVTVNYVAVNGILFYAEKSSGSDSVSNLTDVAVVLAKGTGVDGKRVKLAFFDGTTKTVDVADDAYGAKTNETDIKNNTDAGTDVGYNALNVGGVYEYAVSGDKYSFTSIDKSGDAYGDYTALTNGFTSVGAVATDASTAAEAASQTFGGKKVADNAVILLVDGTHNDVKKITGKQYKSVSAAKITGGTIAFQAKIDGLKQVAAAVVAVSSFDSNYTTNDNYGYIVSDAEDVSGNSVTYDVWTAKGLVTVTEKTNQASARQARTIIGYSNIKEDSSVASGKLIEDVAVIDANNTTRKFGALNFNGTKNAYDQLNSTDAARAYKYNITSDTQILYVDTKEKTGSETGSFSDATDYQNVYVPNAFYIIDDNADGDNKDLALIIYDTANKFYGANEKTLTKAGAEKGLISYVEDSYGDEVTFNGDTSKDSIAQGNLITVTLKNTTTADKSVSVTLTNAKFVDGNATTKDVSIAAGTETQVTFVLDGTNNATITVANK